MGPRDHETDQEECLLWSQADCVYGRWPLLLGDPICLRSDEFWRKGVYRRWYSVPQPKTVRTRTQHPVKSRLLLIYPGPKLKTFLFIEIGLLREITTTGFAIALLMLLVMYFFVDPTEKVAVQLLGVSLTFGPPQNIRFLVAPNPTNMITYMMLMPPRRHLPRPSLLSPPRRKADRPHSTRVRQQHSQWSGWIQK